MKSGIILGVPFYSNADLVRPLVESIEGSNLDANGRKVCCLFVVDSPDDIKLTDEVQRAAVRLNQKLPTTIITNDRNLGFVRSANKLIAKAIEQRADLILMNSDVVLFENTIQEMLDVAATDPMIGFVSPRTNDTTICTFPVPSTEEDDPVRLYQTFRSLASRLPRVTYVPTAVGCCLFMRGRLLQDLGGFDPIFGQGYNEENDLIARANRYGYRAVIANWAYAFDARQPSFTSAQRNELEKRNSAILQERYPHYYPAVSRYLKSPSHMALLLISCLRQGSLLSIAFDFSSFKLHKKNGTTEYGTRLIESFVKLFASKYKIYAICEAPAWQYYDLDKIDGLNWSPVASEAPFAAVVRLCQPFNPRSVGLGPSRGAVTIVSMLDCIAYDCLYLCSPELERLWRFVLQFSDAVVYISEFSKQQFARRFGGVERGRHVVSMPSTDIDEYCPRIPVPPTGEYLLIVGNWYAHKALRETVEIVRRGWPLERLKVLGLKLPECPDIPSYDSGALSAAGVQDFFSRAKAVIFPSHYEGFGFPVLDALGNSKAVFVRDLPVYAEIKQRVSSPQNIHVFGTNAELVSLLTPKNFRWDKARCDVGDVGWNRSTRELEAVLAEALDLATVEKIETRLRQLALLGDAFEGASAYRSKVEQLEAQLKESQTSPSWRLTAPLRKLKMYFS